MLEDSGLSSQGEVGLAEVGLLSRSNDVIADPSGGISLCSLSARGFSLVSALFPQI